MKTYKSVLTILVSTTLLFSLNVHAANKATLKQECTRLLDIADKELEAAKADTLADAGSFTKITVILTDGALAKQFGSYEKCIRKANRARQLLDPYRKQSSKNK